LEVKSDGVITVPPDLSKEFVENIRSRADTVSKEEVSKQGDMKIIDACAPRTMRVLQKITSISLSQNLTASQSFFGRVTQDTKQEVSISTALRIEDCDTGKLVYSYDYVANGTNPAQILQRLVNYNIYLAYYARYQR
jgi:endo-alpha-1,4-polygalactosaminidase (GH114 family)